MSKVRIPIANLLLASHGFCFFFFCIFWYNKNLEDFFNNFYLVQFKKKILHFTFHISWEFYGTCGNVKIFCNRYFVFYFGLNWNWRNFFIWYRKLLKSYEKWFCNYLNCHHSSLLMNFIRMINPGVLTKKTKWLGYSYLGYKGFR